MGNLMDYMDWRGDVTFAGSPFNEVDNIILAMTTFVDFSGIVPEELDSEPVEFSAAMKEFEKVAHERNYLGVLIPASILNIARKAASCERFMNMKLKGVVNQVDEAEQMQFAALTFILTDGTFYVAFRGTDDTLVGWKEDIRLGFKTPIPAHNRAVQYLTEAAACIGGGIRVGGHSKGGNLALWAAVYCPGEVQERILNVYNNDGPGLFPEVLEQPSFLAIADRVISFIPQSSVVGAILEQGPICRIVKSNEDGIMQHDPLSWEVLGPRFVYLEERSKFGLHFEEAIKHWIYSMSEEEKAHFAEALFSVIDSTGARTLTELNRAKIKNFGQIMKALRGLDHDSRSMMLRTILKLFGGGREVKNKA
ncbi:MAG: Mbeg1-like protein [Eubacteriales bacterium]